MGTSRASRSTCFFSSLRTRRRGGEHASDLRTMRGGSCFSEGPALYAHTNQTVAVFSFFLAQHRPKFFQIVPAFRGNLFTNPPDFFKNFMFHNPIIPSIRGGCRSPAREILPVRRRPATVPQWPRWQCGRQFQVRRKSMPCTAAVATWAASVSALAGINRLNIKARVSSSGCFRIRQYPAILQFGQTIFGCVCIAALDLLHHEHGNEQVVMMATFVPPITRGLLLAGDEQIAAWPGGQQTGDGRFQIDRWFHLGTLRIATLCRDPAAPPGITWLPWPPRPGSPRAWP